MERKKIKEEHRIKKLIKQKLKVTKIPLMKLYDEDTEEDFLFKDFYEFVGFLGAGSFGFVIQAKDLASEEMLAIKVSYHLFLTTQD